MDIGLLFVGIGVGLLATLLVVGALLGRHSRWVRPKGSSAQPTRLGGFLRPYRLRLVVASGLSIVDSALDLAKPWPLAVAVDYAAGGHVTGILKPVAHVKPTEFALLTALALLAIVAASGLAGYLVECLIGNASERIGADLRVTAFGKLQTLSLRFHDRNRTGDLVNRLTSDVGRVQDALVAWFETLLPSSVTLMGTLVVLFLVDRVLGLAALAVAPLLFVLAVVSRRRIKDAQRDYRDHYGALASRATDALRNVRVVQAFSRGTEEQRRFRTSSDEMADSAVNSVKLQARFTPLTELVLAGGSCLVLFVGILRVLDGRIAIGTLLVVFSYVAGIYNPIGQLTRMASLLAKGAASRERLTEILGSDEIVPEQRQTVEAPTGELAVSVSNVDFSYKDGTQVLKEISFDVLPNEVVCLVGASGAGKSTLLSLLLRLYDPDSGSIKLNGVDLRQFRLASLRDRIAIVPQDPWILDGSVGDNIAFGRPDASPEDVHRAGGLALVDEFTARMPEGYDTDVGESGGQLSGGQRRRLALARAMVRDCPLLLLDEPTSGLDAESEAAVMTALRRVLAGRSAIIVSHALNVAMLSDWVLVLADGTVIEEGRPRDLLVAGGQFSRLWQFQGLPQLVPAPIPSQASPAFAAAPAATNPSAAGSGAASANLIPMPIKQPSELVS
ncbi:MAG: ABC transporter ATP-binding protein [Actinomycetota bacterium]